MLHHSEILRKAQEEIDRVVGRHRLPTMADEQDLPYIRALQAEIIRWRPVVPLVQPHLASEDDEVNGYRIPARSLVWANLQAMSRNEAIYPSPNELKPERFLNEDGQFTRKDELSIFGYGRRSALVIVATGRWLTVRLLDAVLERIWLHRSCSLTSLPWSGRWTFAQA